MCSTIVAPLLDNIVRMKFEHGVLFIDLITVQICSICWDLLEDDHDIVTVFVAMIRLLF